MPLVLAWAFEGRDDHLPELLLELLVEVERSRAGHLPRVFLPGAAELVLSRAAYRVFSLFFF